MTYLYNFSELLDFQRNKHRHSTGKVVFIIMTADRTISLDLMLLFGRKSNQLLLEHHKVCWLSTSKHILLCEDIDCHRVPSEVKYFRTSVIDSDTDSSSDEALPPQPVPSPPSPPVILSAISTPATQEVLDVNLPAE